MHSPRAAGANDARAALQRLYDYYLRTICHLLPSTPRRLLLTKLGLLPLQVFWWRQTLQFWLFFLLVPFTTLSVWTALPMPFRGVLAILQYG